MQESDAEYYANHRDDDEEWGQPVQGKPPSRRLASMISVRFSADEARTVRAAAAELGQSVSNFVRQAALWKARHADVPPTPATAPPIHLHAAVTWTGCGPTMSPVTDGRFVTGPYTGTFSAAA